MTAVPATDALHHAKPNVPIIEVFRIMRADVRTGTERVIAYGMMLPSGKVIVEWSGRRSIQVFDSLNDAMRGTIRQGQRLHTVGTYAIEDTFTP